MSIAVSTAHHRYTRYQRAGDPIPFFRVWVRVCAPPGCDRRGMPNKTLRCRPNRQARARGPRQDPRGCPGRAVDTRHRRRSASLPAADRGAAGPGLLLPTRNGTRYDRTGAGSSIIKPLVDETNVVLGERDQPALREGVTAHALRKTFFTFLHEAGAPPRGSPTRADTATRRRRCGSTRNRCAGASADITAKPSMTSSMAQRRRCRSHRTAAKLLTRGSSCATSRVHHSSSGGGRASTIPVLLCSAVMRARTDHGPVRWACSSP